MKDRELWTDQELHPHIAIPSWWWTGQNGNSIIVIFKTAYGGIIASIYHGWCIVLGSIIIEAICDSEWAINSNCLACWWIVQIITPRRNYFPRATPEGNNSSNNLQQGAKSLDKTRADFNILMKGNNKMYEYYSFSSTAYFNYTIITLIWRLNALDL